MRTEARKVSPPGVVQSRLQTPRAGRRRNGGLAATTIRAALHRKASLRLRLARGASTWVRQDPGVPRRPHVCGGALPAKPGRKTRRGKEDVRPNDERYAA